MSASAWQSVVTPRPQMGGEVGGWSAWVAFTGVALRHDLDQRDLRDRAGLEGGEVDVELVGVEADRHVEVEAGGDRGAGRRDVAGAKVTSPVAASQAKAVRRACSTPSTATRTLPATGLAIGRS